MKEVIKKLFRKIISNKKTLILGLGLFLFLALVPLHFAQANIFSDIWHAIVNIEVIMTIGVPIAITTGILYIVAILAGLLATALGVIVKWLIVASMNVHVLPGGTGTEAVVTVGWEFSRDFVNLFFIFILAFIGLATILRIESYQMKKTLPSLIIAALLINFSGVFVSFIVDISNLFTNFFASSLGNFDTAFAALKTSTETIAGAVMGVVANITADPLTYALATITPAVKLVAIDIFYIALIFSLFGVFLLFLVRIGILWMLTILAPFAFLARVLPATKKFWDQWLQSLIQWAIIGIPMTFFLYLAQMIISNPINLEWSINPLAGTNEIADAMAELFSPILALLFIVLGFMLSIQMAPGTAKTIMNFTKNKAMNTMTSAGLKGLHKLAATKYASERLDKLSGMSNVIPARLGGNTKLGRALGAAPTWAVRKAGQKGQAFKASNTAMIEKEMQDPELQKLVLAQEWGKLAEVAANQGTSTEKRIAIASLLAEHKGREGLDKLDEAMQATGVAGGLTDEEKATMNKLTEEKALGKLKGEEKKEFDDLLAEEAEKGKDAMTANARTRLDELRGKNDLTKEEQAKFEELNDKWLKESGSAKVIQMAADRSPKHMKMMLAADPELAKLNKIHQITTKPGSKIKDKMDMADMYEEMMRDPKLQGLIKSGRSLEDIIKAGPKDEEYDAIASRTSFRNTVRSGVKINHIENLADRTLLSEDFQRAFVYTKGGQFWTQLEEKKGSPYTRRFDKTRRDLWEKDPYLLAKNNPGSIKGSFVGPQRHLNSTLDDILDGKEEGKHDPLSDVKKADLRIQQLLRTKGKGIGQATETTPEEAPAPGTAPSEPVLTPTATPETITQMTEEAQQATEEVARIEREITSFGINKANLENQKSEAQQKLERIKNYYTGLGMPIAQQNQLSGAIAAKTEIDNLDRQINTAQSNINSAQTRLSAAKTKLDTTEANLNAAVELNEYGPEELELAGKTEAETPLAPSTSGVEPPSVISKRNRYEELQKQRSWNQAEMNELNQLSKEIEPLLKEHQKAKGKIAGIKARLFELNEQAKTDKGLDAFQVRERNNLNNELPRQKAKLNELKNTLYGTEIDEDAAELELSDATAAGREPATSKIKAKDLETSWQGQIPKEIGVMLEAIKNSEAEINKMQAEEKSLGEEIQNPKITTATKTKFQKDLDTLKAKREEQENELGRIKRDVISIEAGNKRGKVRDINNEIINSENKQRLLNRERGVATSPARIKEIDAEIANEKTKVNNLTSERNELNKRIAELKQTVESAQEPIKAPEPISAGIRSRQGKKIVEKLDSQLTKMRESLERRKAYREEILNSGQADQATINVLKEEEKQAATTEAQIKKQEVNFSELVKALRAESKTKRQKKEQQDALQKLKEIEKELKGK